MDYRSGDYFKVESCFCWMNNQCVLFLHSSTYGCVMNVEMTLCCMSPGLLSMLFLLRSEVQQRHLWKMPLQLMCSVIALSLCSHSNIINHFFLLFSIMYVLFAMNLTHNVSVLSGNLLWRRPLVCELLFWSLSQFDKHRHVFFLQPDVGARSLRAHL